MQLNKKTKILTILLLLAMTVRPALALTAVSTNYKLQIPTLSNSAGNGIAASYILKGGVAGDTSPGQGTSPNYHLCAGFVEESFNTNCAGTQVLPPIVTPSSGGGGRIYPVIISPLSAEQSTQETEQSTQQEEVENLQIVPQVENELPVQIKQAEQLSPKPLQQEIDHLLENNSSLFFNLYPFELQDNIFCENGDCFETVLDTKRDGLHGASYEFLNSSATTTFSQPNWYYLSLVIIGIISLGVIIGKKIGAKRK